MSQDPNVPKIKIGEDCKKQVEPLVIAFEELIKSVSPNRGLLGFAQVFSHMESARDKVNQARWAADIISDQDVGEILNLIGPIPPEFPLTADNVQTLLNNLKQAAAKTLEALLNAAVDCECREAKAAYDQLGSAALQTVLEGKGEGDGRPRRYTEIPGQPEEA